MIRQIKVSDVKKAIDDKEDFLLLDVRTPQEFEKGNISGSINIPLNDLNQKAEQIFVHKKKPVFVYCLSGSRSTQAAQILSDNGFLDIYNMTNGLLAWRAQGLPLTSSS